VLPRTGGPHFQFRVGPMPGFAAWTKATHWPVPVERPRYWAKSAAMNPPAAPSLAAAPVAPLLCAACWPGPGMAAMDAAASAANDPAAALGTLGPAGSKRT